MAPTTGRVVRLQNSHSSAFAAMNSREKIRPRSEAQELLEGQQGVSRFSGRLETEGQKVAPREGRRPETSQGPETAWIEVLPWPQDSGNSQ